MIRKAFVVSDFVTLTKCFLFLVFVFWLLADCGPLYFAVHGTLEFHGNPRLAPLFLPCSLFPGLKPGATKLPPRWGFLLLICNCELPTDGWVLDYRITG